MLTCKLDEVSIADWAALPLKLGVNGLLHSLENGQGLVKTLVLWTRKFLPDTQKFIAFASITVLSDWDTLYTSSHEEDEICLITPDSWKR